MTAICVHAYYSFGYAFRIVGRHLVGEFVELASTPSWLTVRIKESGLELFFWTLVDISDRQYR